MLAGHFAITYSLSVLKYKSFVRSLREGGPSVRPCAKQCNHNRFSILNAFLLEVFVEV